MPFNNEDKIPFKDLSVCHQQEIIDTLAGRYDDREVYGYCSTWSKVRTNYNTIVINSIYKVVQKDPIISIQRFTEHNDGYISLFGRGNSINWVAQLRPGKYKLIKIEE